MALEKITCITASCDHCGDGWWKGDPEDNGCPHFVTEAAARKQLADSYEWKIERQLDGRFLMLCNSCAAKDDCQRLGHAWDTVSFDDPDPTVPDHVRLRPPAVMCTRCSRVRRDEHPPAGHPDSMEIVLSDADEEFLAAVDEELFPEEAM